jgi:hypothetical protein
MSIFAPAKRRVRGPAGGAPVARLAALKGPTGLEGQTDLQICGETRAIEVSRPGCEGRNARRMANPGA